MATCTINTNEILSAIDTAVEEGARYMVDKIVPITPRDPNRLPKDPSQKVTGALKRAIDYHKIGNGHYRVGVLGSGGTSITGVPASSGPGASPAEYGYYLEYGTRKMKPRSFIEKGKKDYGKQAIQYINQVFNKQPK